MKSLIAAVLFLSPFLAPAEERVDLEVVHRIKTEAFENSRVMDHLFYLADVYGPRLTNSPAFRQAGEWAAKRLREYGLEHVAMEKWGPFGPGWECTKFAAHLLEPEYAPLIGFPLAWSQGTGGPIVGEPLLAVLGSEQDLAKFKGKLRGKIVLIEAPRTLSLSAAPPAHRFTSEELVAMEKALDPVPPVPPAAPDAAAERAARFRGQLNQFLIEEGVAVLVTPGQRGEYGSIHAKSVPSRSSKPPLPPPTIAIASEHYNRIARLLSAGVRVRLEVDIEARFLEQPQDTFNVVGEIPGATKPAEIVMAGAHLDSWNSGTGATDNGIGVAVVMEAVRILKALDRKMDRTVRVGFWAAEEHGLLGSKAYLTAHAAEQPRISGYFNFDGGNGKIRGVYLQDNDAARPAFQAWLRPFSDLGAGNLASRPVHGSDHDAFDAAGVPGFHFIQDPLDYFSRAHHSNMDLYDRAQPGNLMQSAAIVASFLYHAATRPEMLPRKPRALSPTPVPVPR
jgi:hypothetical protein